MRIRDILAERQAAPSAAFLDALAHFTDNIYVYDEAKWREIVRVFDAEMPVLEQSYTVWRGDVLGGRSELAPEGDFRVRDTIAFPGYVSTSLDRSVAEKRARIDELNCKWSYPHVLFKIVTKPGARGVVVNDHLGPEKNHYYWENEILIDKGSVFSVVAREPKRWCNGTPGTYGYWHPDKIYWEVELEQTA